MQTTLSTNHVRELKDCFNVAVQVGVSAIAKSNIFTSFFDTMCREITLRIGLCKICKNNRKIPFCLKIVVFNKWTELRNLAQAVDELIIETYLNALHVWKLTKKGHNGNLKRPLLELFDLNFFYKSFDKVRSNTSRQMLFSEIHKMLFFLYNIAIVNFIFISCK